MNKEELQAAYKRLILPENRDPYHFEAKEKADIVEAYNPLCGDKYHLYLSEDEMHFDGIGCAVSKASTSLLIKEMEGKTPEERQTFCQDFIEAVENGNPSPKFSEALNVMISLKEFDGRVDCIQLSWKALANHLEKSK